MGKLNILQPYLWSEIKSQFQKVKILFSAEAIFLLSITFQFSLLQNADAIISVLLIQPDDPTFTQLLATHYDCSKQYNLRQFSSTRVQKCTQTDSEIEYTRTYASVVNRPKAKKLKIFRRSATIQKTRVFCAQGAQDNYYIRYRMDWHTNSMQLPKERDYNECDNFFRNLNSTDSAELNQKFLNRNVTYFHRMRFQVQIEKKRTPFTVTVLDTVHTGVFTYQPKSYDWITRTANSKSRCKDDQENFLTKIAGQ